MIFMCSTNPGFSMMPDDLEELKKNTTMFWCRSCKKTFIKKGATECLNCGSNEIKPRAP